ncbi:MAG: hypothetical protein P1U36_00565 [Legionellaceae bacterium]|nr:hypothetical protein [Legionellaceae bacterium]
MTIKIKSIPALLKYFENRDPTIVDNLVFNLAHPDTAADVFVLLNEKYHVIVWPYLKKDLINNITNLSDFINILISLEISIAEVFIAELQLSFVNHDKKQDNLRELSLSDILTLYQQLKTLPNGYRIFNSLLNNLDQTLLITICMRIEQLDLHKQSADMALSFFDAPEIEEATQLNSELANIIESLTTHPTYISPVGTEYILAILSYLNEEFHRPNDFYLVSQALMPLLINLDAYVFSQCLQILPDDAKTIFIRCCGENIRNIVKTRSDHILILSELFEVRSTASNAHKMYYQCMGENISNLMTDSKALPESKTDDCESRNGLHL